MKLQIFILTDNQETDKDFHECSCYPVADCIFPNKDASLSLHSCSVCHRKIFGACMADKFENNMAVLCRHCRIAGINLLSMLVTMMFTNFSFIVEDNPDNQENHQPQSVVIPRPVDVSQKVDIPQPVDLLEIATLNRTKSDSNSKAVQYSAFDLFIFFRDMKANQIDLTLNVGGKNKTYSVTFDPDDNLSDRKQVSKGNLIKRLYSEEEAKTKWREKLFGYDVYWGYNAALKKEGYICPALICKNDGASTGLVLKRILRTRCATPKLWMVIYSIHDDQCYIIKDHIVGWMKKDPKSDINRDWWTNPNVVFDHEKCSK